MPIRTKEFYKFQNKIMDSLRDTNLSKNECKYCWTLFRDTCGYGNYKVKIKRDKISELTGILEVNVSRTERRLKERNIIIINGKYKGFNRNIIKWKKVSLLIPNEKVSLPILKGIATDTKKGIATDTLITNKKRTLKEGQIFYKKLSGKEIEKLELDPWYKAIMWNEGKFSIFYIEGTISDYPYNTRMSCWYKYVEAVNVRDKEAFFSHLLREYQEETKDQI